MPEIAPIAGYHYNLQPGLDQGEALHLRTEQALEDCDFVRSPELERSIEGFYTAHYQLASVMRLGLYEGQERQLSGEDQKAYLNNIINDSYFDRTQIESAFRSRMQGYGIYEPYVQQITPLLARVRLARLDNPDNPELRKVELSTISEACDALFAEASVGVTTLRGTEADLAFLLRQSTLEQMKKSGLFPHLDDYSEEKQLEATFQPINRAIENFRQDTRFAGQLLFHNTGHFRDISRNGELSPRRMQQQRHGAANFQTAEYHEGHIHSPTPHWSENFDPISYRGDRAGTDGGTVAVPLVKIIQNAPYARDAQYGVLTLKPESIPYATEGIPRNDSVATIGNGGPDRQGMVGIDRTFYSSPHDVPPSAPIESAPDGYTIPLDPETYWVELEDKDAGKTWDADSRPEPYVIPVRAYEESDSNGNPMSVAVWRERRKRVIARRIKDLQQRSIDQYPRQVVVPLRAGVMDFYVPDDGRANGKRRAQFTKIAR